MEKIAKLSFCLIISILLTAYMPGGTGIALANTTNIALNKPVTTSSVRPARSELVGALAVDGIDDAEPSRWSSKRATGSGTNEGPSEDGTVEQWITVDFEEAYNLDEVYISWEAAYATSYKIQGSVEGSTFTDLYVRTNSTGGKHTISKNSFIQDIPVRYLRILCMTPFRSDWGYSIYEIEAKGTPVSNENLALGKTVSYSGVEGGKSGNDWTYPQFVGEKAVDGDLATRYSADKLDNQWIIVDLGSVLRVSQVTIRFFREASAYSIAISEEGTTYRSILKVENNPDINKETVKDLAFLTMNVRYIKIEQTKMFTSNTNGQQYGMSITEIEAYRHAKIDLNVDLGITSARTALDRVEADGFSVPGSSGNKVIFPEEITDDYQVEIYGSDAKAIVGLDGVYHQPLVDKTIHLMYKVTNKKDATDVAISANDCVLTIPGKYPNAGENKALEIIPALQEWYGYTGQYTLGNTSKIMYSDAGMVAKANLLAEYAKNLLGKELNVVQGTAPEAGDIYLVFDQSAEIAGLGNEGYWMEIDDVATIKSSTGRGYFYGGVSMIQALYLNKATLSVNKGITRDYPKYPVRSISIDIARSEVRLDYIEEITKMLPFFKVNEIALHINDDRGDVMTNTTIGSEGNIKQARDLSSFRIENTKGIGNHFYQIPKADYIRYQQEAAEYEVTVVTELDTPAHSVVFSLDPDMVDNMYDVKHLRILGAGSTNVNNVTLHQPTMDFVDAITQELIGTGPGTALVQSPVFHFGTDEYPSSALYSEAMQQYIHHYTDMIQSRGYEARAWASSDGASGFRGYVTPQNSEVTYYLWAPYWADVRSTLANGNPIINCSGSWVYIVPGGNAGYSNYLNVKRLYDEWSVNDITTTRGSGGAIIPVSHPQLRGASVVLWNDDGFLLDGISDFDIYDRLKYGFPIIAERTWYGAKTAGQEYADFESRSNYLLRKGPASNPLRYVDSEDETIVHYDFEAIENSIIKDASANGYDGNLSNAQIVAGETGNALSLDGSSYISAPFNTVGFPATVSFDVYVEKTTGKDASFFEGKDGKINYDQKNAKGEYTGKLGYERDGYTYVFDYAVETEKWLNIILEAEVSGVRLYVDGRYRGGGARTEFGPYLTKNLSTSMVLPTEKIGNGIVGKLDNLIITNKIEDRGFVWYVGTPAQWAGKQEQQIKATFSEAYATAEQGDQIWIAAGEYSIPSTTLKHKVSVYGSFAGTENSPSEREKVAGGKAWEFVNPSILRNSSPTQGQLFSSPSAASALTLDGFVMEGAAGTTNCKAVSITTGAGSDNNYIISNCIIRNFRATTDGGGFNVRYTTEILNCLITNNESTTKGGGGYFDNVTIHDCEVINNRAPLSGTAPAGSGNGCGGGLFMANNTVTGYNLYVADNTANFAGGIFLRTAGRLYNSVIVNNTANRSGGGLAFDERDSNSIGYNLTIANNRANDANGSGGVCFSADGSDRIQSLYNTILWNNTNGAGAVANIGINNSGAGKAKPVARNNLIDRITDYPADIELSASVVATDSASIFDANWLTKAGSPAEDKGTSTIATSSSNITLPETDRAGNLRVQGAAIDIGPYETTGNVSVTGISPDTSLRIYYTATGVHIVSNRSIPAKWVNIVGKTMKSFMLSEGDQELSLAAYPKGIYLLVVGDKTFKILNI